MIDFSMEAEQAVLGSILLDQSQETSAKAVERLEPDYWSEAHRPVFEAICELQREGTSIDIVTLSQWLYDRQLTGHFGSIDYLGGLVEQVPSVANAGHYMKIVETTGIRRKASPLHSG